MVCKDEVVDWFHKLNGAGRLDAMCALLDVCLPFEIRFLGTYMENLGRRDFHELRDADHRANSFLHLPRPGVTDRQALLNALQDSPQANASTPNGSVHPSGHPPGATPRPNQHPNTTEPAGNRVSSGQSEKGRVGGNGGAPPEVSFNSSRNEENLESGNKECSGGREEVEYKEGKCILVEDILRRRLVLYLSLLSATNRRCANSYYKVLNEVGPLLETSGWLETLEEKVLDEMALLYTLAANHPAFTFDQRRSLADVGNSFRGHQAKLEAPKVVPQAAPTFFATAVQGFDPKYGHYYIHCIPHPVGPMQWQTPNNPNNLMRNGNGSGEESHQSGQNVQQQSVQQSPMAFTMPPYHPFPAIYYNQSPIHQLQHPFSNIPVQTSISQMGLLNHPSQILPNNLTNYQPNPRVPGSAPLNHNNNNNTAHIQAQPRIPHASHSPALVNGPQSILTVPSGGGVSAQVPPPPISTACPHGKPQNPHLPSTPQNSTSILPPNILHGAMPPNNSSIIPPAGTIPSPGNVISQNSIGNQMVNSPNFPPHNQSNHSVDGNESEECCWDSSESSPFQSPLHSLTPSRSQSPLPVNYLAPVATQTLNFIQPPPPIQPVHLVGAPTITPEGLTVSTSSSLSQRPVMTSAASAGLPPPSASQVSQGRILAKNAQNHLDDYMSTHSIVNCMTKPVSGNAVNGIMSTMTERRPLQLGKGNNVTALIKNLSPGYPPPPTGIPPPSNPQQQQPTIPTVLPGNPPSQIPGVQPSQSQGMVVIPAPATSSSFAGGSAPPHLVGSGGRNNYGKDSPRRPVNRRANNNNNNNNNSPNQTPCSVSNHFNSPHPPKNISNSTSNNYTHASSLPSYLHPSSKGVSSSPAHGISKPGQGPPSSGGVTSQESSSSNNSIQFTDFLGPSPDPLCNGIQNILPPNNESFNNLSSGLSVNIAAPLLNLPLPTPPTLPPSHSTSRNPLLLQLSRGQDLVTTEESQFPSHADEAKAIPRAKMSCYTCGAQSHYGPDCTENTMEEMTKHPYRINFLPENSSSEAKDGE